MASTWFVTVSFCQYQYSLSVFTAYSHDNTEISASRRWTSIRRSGSMLNIILATLNIAQVAPQQ